MAIIFYGKHEPKPEFPEGGEPKTLQGGGIHMHDCA